MGMYVLRTFGRDESLGEIQRFKETEFPGMSSAIVFCHNYLELMLFSFSSAHWILAE